MREWRNGRRDGFRCHCPMGVGVRIPPRAHFDRRVLHQGGDSAESPARRTRESAPCQPCLAKYFWPSAGMRPKPAFITGAIALNGSASAALGSSASTHVNREPSPSGSTM